MMAANQGYAKNVELVGFHDLAGKPGFQMAMQEVGGRYYLYLAHFVHSGWAIVDVTEPARPEYLKFVPGPDKAGQTTLKLQLADGILVTSLSGGIPLLMGMRSDDPFEAGVYIWDVRDPVNPQLLAQWSSGGFGVHRFFWSGGRYLHLAASCAGFAGFIYRILDIAEPRHPVEVGRWWLPEQWQAGALHRTVGAYGEVSALDAPALHGPAYPKGNLAYLSYGGGGLVILDIADITLPRLFGQLQHHPPFAGGAAGARCHTVLPLSQRPYAVMTSEGERYSYFNKQVLQGKPQPLNFIGMVDVVDPAQPTLIATFPYPEVPPGFPYPNFNDCGIGCPGPFGPHNLHEPHYHPSLEDRNDRIYCAYFHAGLRIYDISDPFRPREIGYFIPPNPAKWAFNNAAGNLFPGPRLATAEDVLVDKRGYIYLDTAHDGLYILRCAV